MHIYKLRDTRWAWDYFCKEKIKMINSNTAENCLNIDDLKNSIETIDREIETLNL